MTIILLVEYDGTNYAGWQTQQNSNTVQEKLNIAIRSILHNENIKTVAAGRTDAGVHAGGQVVHFVCKQFPVKENKIPFAINTFLPNDIRVKKAIITESSFHARFDAVAREYIYQLSTCNSVFNRFYSWSVPYKIDENLLLESANVFIGKHDFTTFSKLNKNINNYICNIEICKWLITNKNNFKLIIKADRFVYGMVRALVGAMLEVSRNKRTIEELSFALANRDRKYIAPLAAAHGLILNKIYYQNIDFDAIL